MARRLIGILVGVFLVYPGAELLRWLSVDVLGLYADMTLQEAFLAEIVILLAAFLIGGGGRARLGGGIGETGPASPSARRSSAPPP
jgi:hypothetical protein